MDSFEVLQGWEFLLQASFTNNTKSWCCRIPRSATQEPSCKEGMGEVLLWSGSQISKFSNKQASKFALEGVQVDKSLLLCFLSIDMIRYILLKIRIVWSSVDLIICNYPVVVSMWPFYDSGIYCVGQVQLYIFSNTELMYYWWNHY